MLAGNGAQVGTRCAAQMPGGSPTQTDDDGEVADLSAAASNESVSSGSTALDWIKARSVSGNRQQLAADSETLRRRLRGTGLSRNWFAEHL